MPRPPSPPLPRDWPQHVKSAVLHVVSLAQVAITCGRAKAAGTRHSIDRVRAEPAGGSSSRIGDPKCIQAEALARCLDPAGSNDDGVLDVSDVVRILLDLFGGAIRMALPREECGAGAMPDRLPRDESLPASSTPRPCLLPPGNGQIP